MNQYPIISLLILTIFLTPISYSQVLTTTILNSTACTTTQYFDSTLLNCNTCPSNSNNAGNGTYCSCQTGYYSANQSAIGFKASCTICPSGSAPSADGERCVTCPNGVNSVTGDCTCPSGAVPIDVDITGAQLTTKQCITCATDALPGPSTIRYTSCQSCGYGKKYNNKTTPWTCECDTTSFTTAGDTCVSNTDLSTFNTNYPLSSAQSINYYDIDNGGGILEAYQFPQSLTMVYFYYKSVVGCTVYSDPQSCQTFANLCVLNLYNEQNTICKLYQQQMSKIPTSVGADPGWKTGLPWLYYQNSAPQTIQSTYLALQVTFGSSTSFQRNELDYWLAKYDIYGNYYGFEKLTNQLLLCPNSVAAGVILKSFGTTFTNDCTLDLNSFINVPTIFYEMFLKDVDGSYKPIPVLVTNYRDSKANQPNLDSDMTNWKLTRRFFVVDTISGLSGQNTFPGTANTTVLRYAKSIMINVKLQNNAAQKINLPYLSITYRERTTQIIQSSQPSTSISFKTTYEMNTSNFWTVAIALFITTNVLIGIATFIRIYIWTKYNAMSASPDTYITWLVSESILLLMKTWGDVMFFFLLFMTGYWFIFFKMQDIVYILMPDSSNTQEYYAFKVVFGLVCAFQIISILDLIRRQCKVDFIVVDWEKPKMFIKRDPESPPIPMVSAWRTLFVCNEINELQVERYISFEFMLIIFAFFMRGLNWENLAQITPYMDTSITGVPMNIVLKYFLTTFLFMAIGIIMLGLRRLVTTWYPTSMQEFIDLCSFANISIFFLDGFQHGYYLHGISTSGSAEGSVEFLRAVLENESKGHGRNRGMIANDSSGLQTFEIFIPKSMRNDYNGIFKYHVGKEIADKKRIQELSNQSLIKGIGKPIPEGLDLDYIERKRNELIQILKIYIEGVIADSGRQIIDKSWIQRLFDYPPIELEKFISGNPIFCKDPFVSLQSIFIMGNDFSLLLWNVAIYQLFDLATGSTLVALGLLYICEKFLLWFRSYLGERNLSEKTLVDDAFLL